jgi:CRP/FNR family cyclic AMP-dependent transcriptional regulator
MSISQAVSMGIGPLAALGEDQLKELAPHGAARSYPKHAVIITEGDETDSLYVLIAGRVKVFVSDEDGK